MTHVTLTKHHALANDFLCAVAPSVPVTAQHVVAWCDRRRGLGADGVMTAERGHDGVWQMVLRNADGRRAEISGNGIRCLGQAVVAAEGLPLPTELAIRTDAGVRQLVVRATEDPATVWVRVSMGAAKPGPASSSVLEAFGVEVLDQLGVDLGNPHLVVRVDDPAVHDLARIGPGVEADYPDGLNVHLVAVESRQQLRLRVWERGVGLTEACGSGACAAAWAARQWDLVDDVVQVDMPGGSVTVEVADPMVLTGPATFVATVVVDA